MSTQTNEHKARAKRILTPVRAVVKHADGTYSVHYSIPDVPWYQVRKRQALRRWMREMQEVPLWQ